MPYESATQKPYGAEMPKFLVENLTKQTISLGVEPWAGQVVLAPDGKVEFEYEDPAEVEFALLDDGPSVTVVSDRVKWSANGEERTYHAPREW